MKSKLSVIIITLNEELALPRLLKALKRQTFTDFEIIVSDAHSTDKTRQIALNQGCRVVNGGKWSIGRNNGAKVAKADYLLFLDADGWIPHDFLEVNFNAFKESNKGTATVPIKPDSDSKTHAFYFYLYHLWAKATSKVFPHCSGCSLFTRKDVFNEIKGFDETVTFAEDHDYARRSFRYGFTILPKEIYTSVRRINKGTFKFISTYIYTGFYRIFYGEVRNNAIPYST